MADVTSIDIRIDTIEVEELGRADVPEFRHDVERELGRLIDEGGVPPVITGSRDLISTTMPDPLQGDRSLAARVAAAVYGALTA